MRHLPMRVTMNLKHKVRKGRDLMHRSVMRRKRTRNRNNVKQVCLMIRLAIMTVIVGSLCSNPVC